MKILQVFDFFSPGRGGGTVNLLYNMSRALARKNHAVEILTSDYQLDEKYIASIPEVKINIFHCRVNLGAFYFIPGTVNYIREHLKEYDIIHLHAARSFQNIVIHHYARKYKIPYILSTHGSLIRSYGGIGSKWFLKWLFDIFFGFRIYKHCCIATSDSEIGVAEYKNFGVPEKNILVIHNPLPVEDYANLPQFGQFRGKYGLKDKKIVLFLGRISRIKGIEFLVDGFSRLAEERDVKLVIVGDDFDYKATLEKQIANLGLQEKVLFTGFLDGEDKKSAFVDADVVAMLSRYEYGTIAPLEAVLCNAPIIVSRHTGAGGDIKKMDAGYLVDYGNIDQLVQMLDYILRNPEESRIKAKKAAEYVRNNLSMAKRVEEYEKVYSDVIKRCPR